MPKSIARWYFLGFGLLDLVTLVTAFFYSLHVLWIYFSYFTVLSNIIITTIFLSIGSLNKSNFSKNRFINRLYGPSVLYMCITGVVFWTVLRNHHHLAAVPWINIVLHLIMPIVALLGWIIYPLQKKIPFTRSFVWLLFPLTYVGYTLIRGPFAHWYPYPFLNPSMVGGYFGVLLWVIGILFCAWIASLLLIWIARRHAP